MKGIDISNLSEDTKKLNPQLAEELKTEPASKYRNVRAESKGLRFQSGKEAAEISKLIIADEKHQGVYALRLQVRFPVAKGITYVADAVYLDDKLQAHIIDCKGYPTPEFKIKAKLFREKYGQPIELI